MAIEYELKFQASQKKLQAILTGFSENQEPICMVTTYYDTPSGLMAAKKYTLRQRMENGKSICTLKTPAGSQGRHEYEVCCDSILSAIPAFCAQGAPAELPQWVREGLVPICGARFQRIAIPVTYGDCQLELALDNGILTGGGRELPLCEVEVELKSGSTEGADLFALELANEYHLTPETKSKFKRALELYKGEAL